MHNLSSILEGVRLDSILDGVRLALGVLALSGVFSLFWIIMLPA
jgi:hypothetical protein